VLAEGLPLLRGVPLDGQRWLWADEEYLASALAGDAVAMPTELATQRLQAGDMYGALAATDAGRWVIPMHDQLTELSLRASIAAGDRRRAVAVYEAYERAAAARREPVAQEIVELRNELTGATPA
jgi:hypothetical protein